MGREASLTDDLLARFSRMVEERLGLHFPPSQWVDLERRVVSAASKLGFDDTVSCLEWFLQGSDPGKAVEELARHLTISETYFFRDWGVFQYLEENILPGLVAARSGTTRRLKLWSAACAGGEEAYSLAILMDRYFPFLKQWQISIHGSDINHDMLDKARQALYSKWSFRNAPEWLLGTYFVPIDGLSFQLDSRIRDRVQFFSHNLATGNVPSLVGTEDAVDIIMCRNVLMYFTEERRHLAIDGLVSVLAEDGRLFVSAGEIGLIDHAKLHLVSHGQTMFFTKTGGARSRIGSRQRLSSGKISAPEKRIHKALHHVDPPAPPPSRRSEAATGIQLRRQQDAGEEADRSITEAITLYHQMKYGECIALLNSVVSEGRAPAGTTTPGADLLLILAKAHANLGDLQGAESWCDRALAEDRLCPDAHYLRAQILQEQGLPDEAMEELRQLLFLDPGCVMAHFASANLLRQKGREKEAMKQYRTVESLLKGYDHEQALSLADGLTAGRLLHIVQQMAGAAS
jgi:chemotaxis protein methyltransferase CheR